MSYVDPPALMRLVLAAMKTHSYDPQPSIDALLLLAETYEQQQLRCALHDVIADLEQFLKRSGTVAVGSMIAAELRQSCGMKKRFS